MPLPRFPLRLRFSESVSQFPGPRQAPAPAPADNRAPTQPHILLALLLAALAMAAPEVRAAERARIPLDDLRAFAEVMEQVRTAYVEPVDDRTLLENAIKGMLSELDPYSAYLDKKALAELREQTSGQVAGIGVELGFDHGRIAVITPIDDSPAARAGMQPGDIVLSIDRAPTKGMLLSEAVDRLRGPAGSSVVLELLREGKPRQTVRLTRAVVTVTSVRAGIPELGYGYLRISQFQLDTAKDMLAALMRLRVWNGGRLRGLILDLRNNPGGIVQSSVEVVDAFLDKGLIVSTRGRVEGARFTFSATRGDVTQGTPIVVLVNEGSASAAEIVAGALQDQHRATIVGMRSYGKGSVQTILALSGDRAIKLTTALYYTPAGRSIQNTGINPDLAVVGNRAAALADGVVTVTNAASAASAPTAPPPVRYTGTDAQIAAAVSYLRSGGSARPPAPRPATPTQSAQAQAAQAQSAQTQSAQGQPAPTRPRAAAR